MKHLIFLTLVLSSCGVEQAALTNNEAIKANDQVHCELAFIGQWSNDGDHSTFTIQDNNGACEFSMSCGAQGTLVALNGNYELQDQTNSQACNFPNTFTIDGKVKLVSIMLYQGKLLTSINNESSNEWSKIN